MPRPSPLRSALVAAAAAALTLSACATVTDPPNVRFASAAARGGIQSLTVGRPSLQQVDRAADVWLNAVADAWRCGVPRDQVFQTGMVAALELAAMQTYARGGGEAERQAAVGRYLMRAGRLALEGGPRPAETRCRTLAAWAPRVVDQGRDALREADRRGELGRGW